MLKIKHYYYLSLILCIFCFGFSYAEDYKQISKDLTVLLKEAEQTQSRLISKLKELSSSYKNAVIINPGIKQFETIDQLLKTRWNGDASRITDYSRATIGVETIYDVYKCLDDFKKSFFPIISIRDNFFSPYPEGYRDINIVFRDPINNHLGEVQINALSLLEFKKEKGTQLFHDLRTLQAKPILEKRSPTAEEIDLINKIIKESSNGYNKAFVESLKFDNKPLRLGIYGVLIKNNQILLTKTKSGSRWIYNFPGGGVEENEGFIDTLKRECAEELGINDINIKDLLYTTKDLYINEDFPDTYMFNLYYKIELNDLDKLSYKEAKWFPINNLPLNEMLPIDKSFLKNLEIKK